MIGQMAIAIALLGFTGNDLGRLVTPTFLFRSRSYLPYYYLHIVQK